MAFALFLFADFESQNMNPQFHSGSFEIGMKQELQELGNRASKTGTRNWRKGLGIFTHPIGNVKSMKY